MFPKFNFETYLVVIICCLSLLLYLLAFKVLTMGHIVNLSKLMQVNYFLLTSHSFVIYCMCSYFSSHIHAIYFRST